MEARDIWYEMDVKLIAILRGVRPEEVASIVTNLLEVGFRAIEIPLNSPNAYTSIELAVKAVGATATAPCLIGAGTVLSVEEVERVHATGGNLVVSPNVNTSVINRTKELGMFSAPGVYTPSECMSAIGSGADVLKIFPASNLGVNGFKAYRAVLPKKVELCAVGGIGNADFEAYKRAGASGFGLGSSLYKPGMRATKIQQNAIAAVKAFKDIHS